MVTQRLQNSDLAQINLLNIQELADSQKRAMPDERIREDIWQVFELHWTEQYYDNDTSAKRREQQNIFCRVYIFTIDNKLSLNRFT